MGPPASICSLNFGRELVSIYVCESRLRAVDVSLATLNPEAKSNAIPEMAGSVADADAVLAKFGYAEPVAA